jgi:hypothetical protein
MYRSTLQVFDGATKQGFVVLEVPEAGVASGTQESTNTTRPMIMVDVSPESRGQGPRADRAEALLPLEHRVELFGGQTVLTEMVLSRTEFHPLGVSRTPRLALGRQFRSGILGKIGPRFSGHLNLYTAKGA